MSYSNDHQGQFAKRMPDLPDESFHGDGDLYPPVNDFLRYDYWDESALVGDFSNQPSASDLVINDRHSELPSHSAQQDHVIERPVAQHRRRSGADMEITYDLDMVQERPRRQAARTAPRRRRATAPRADRVVETSVHASAATADMVTGTMSLPRSRTQAVGNHRRNNGVWAWSPIVLPSIRQVLEQALPTLLMAVSLIMGLFIIERAPFMESLWALIVLAPSVMLAWLANPHVHPLWRRCAMLNLAAVGVFYPLLIVRQSYLRVPYVGWGNGTLTMPLVATFTIVVLLVVLALVAAWMSQDDPEYAGVLFLPAAMLVPFFAGATEIVSLRLALIIAASVFLSASVLTVIASMLPGSYPVLVAPVALALEFLVLPLSDSVPIFPTGAGGASKLLFFVVLASTVGLTVGMPSLAGWVRSVRDLVKAGYASPQGA